MVTVPVASRIAVRQLALEADEVIAVMIPEKFSGVGAFYEDFTQVSDQEVMLYLQQLNMRSRLNELIPAMKP